MSFSAPIGRPQGPKLPRATRAAGTPRCSEHAASVAPGDENYTSPLLFSPAANLYPLAPARTWIRSLLEDGDVESQPGPRRSSVTVPPPPSPPPAPGPTPPSSPLTPHAAQALQHYAEWTATPEEASHAPVIVVSLAEATHAQLALITSTFPPRDPAAHTTVSDGYSYHDFYEEQRVMHQWMQHTGRSLAALEHEACEAYEAYEAALKALFVRFQQRRS